jgi:hypothetical protein
MLEWLPLSSLPAHLTVDAPTEVVLLYSSGEQAREKLRLDEHEKGHGARTVLPSLNPMVVLWAKPEAAGRA